VDRREVGFPNQHIGKFTFSPDGSRILVTGDFRGPGIGTSVRLWRAPAVVGGDVEQVELWIHDLAGMELDARGTPRALSPQDRQNRRDRLARLGDPLLREPKPSKKKEGDQ
jgi:hypothetical protein